jgi:hypothetical protein
MEPEFIKNAKKQGEFHLFETLIVLVWIEF